MSDFLFTSESVTEGHPDKTADIISDSILDALLAEDPNSRVAVETLLAKDLVVLGGEVTSGSIVDYEAIVREAILRIGFNDSEIGLDGSTVKIITNITTQSPEIAGGVFNALEVRDGNKSASAVELQGAGDQGIIFGYANSDNDSFFPAAGKLSHLLSAQLSAVRREKNDGILLPDGKTQVTLAYVNGIPVGIDTILVSTQHTRAVNLKQLHDYIEAEVVAPVLQQYAQQSVNHLQLTSPRRLLVNPAGEWHVGSSASDTGLTGRKIIVDSYCGYARHGGGAFSGKDASKTDRSGAYALRWIAKNLVAAGAATELELQVAYAIGSSEPVSLYVDTKNKPHVPLSLIKEVISSVFDLRPGAIIDNLQLRDPATGYANSAKNGHFGKNNVSFSWENLDKVDEISSIIFA
jgi:S-adenosylmethionine synthetase